MDPRDDPVSDELDLVTGQKGSHASRSTLKVPEDDLISYVFGRREEIDPQLKIFVNANDENDFISYGQAIQAVHNIGMRLKEIGLEPGDCVCIHSYNHIHYPLFWLGIVAAGGVVTGTNPAYTTQELIHHLNITNTRFVIVHTNRIETILKAAEECNIEEEEIFVFGGGHADSHHPHQQWIITFQPQAPCVLEEVAQFDQSIQETKLAAYATTSGTTGLPKAAELSHRYFVAQLVGIEGIYDNRVGPIVQLQCLPVFHAFAAPIALLLPLRLGITTYYLPRFHPQHYVEAVQRFQITDTAVVPPIVAALSNLPPHQHGLLQSLRLMICAGAPLATHVQSRLSEILHPELVISQCWGCTEVGWISTFSRPERDFTGSVGHLLPNTMLKIVDPNGCIVIGDDMRGEAFIKSESMLQGYRTRHQPIDKSELCDNEGFYATGDVAYTRHGKIYIQGRTKDIMKVRCWQVSPDEIQSVIMNLTSQGIQDCAVSGYTALDRDGLEITKLRAYVVRSTNSKITAEDIQAHVKKELVTYKQLTRGVLFVESIPRNPTGKILRRLLHTATVISDACNDESIDQDAVESNELSKVF